MSKHGERRNAHVEGHITHLCEATRLDSFSLAPLRSSSSAEEAELGTCNIEVGESECRQLELGPPTHPSPRVHSQCFFSDILTLLKYLLWRNNADGTRLRPEKYLGMYLHAVDQVHHGYLKVQITPGLTFLKHQTLSSSVTALRRLPPN